MGGRGSSSGIGGSSFTTYTTIVDSKKGLGLGNGGETDKWMAGLTDMERKSIVKYTGSGYTSINEYLRGQISGSPVLKSVVGNIEKAVNKFNLENPTVFHRGSSAGLLGGANSVTDINKMVGQVVVDKGFTSTSATSGKGFTHKPIQYHIQTPSGKGIGAFVQGMSNFASENEFVFNHGSGFKILGAYQKHGEVHVNMRYIGRMS